MLNEVPFPQAILRTYKTLTMALGQPPSTDFIDRILTAIASFDKGLTNDRRHALYQWLHYGGVRLSSAISVTDEDREIIQNDCVVDFVACTRGFLSYRASAIYYFTKREDIEAAVQTIAGFLDHLDQQKVCPEYNNQLSEAQKLLRGSVVEELWATRGALQWLPGDFNMACSTLFGGSYNGGGRNDLWEGHLQPGESAFVGFTPEQATQIVGFAIAGAGDDEVYNRYAELVAKGTAALDVSRVIRGSGFEITEILFPTSDCKDLYRRNTNEYRPVGRVVARAWKNPLAPPEDITLEERASTEPSELYTFFAEEIVQQHLSVGQKIVATVRELNCGVYFFDELSIIYPSFELWTPNDLVHDYRLPKGLPDACV